MNREPEPPNRLAGAHPELSDKSLIRRLRAGSEDAATQLYLRYAERLRHLARAEFSADLARRIEADDIVQSVFLSFFRGVRQEEYDVPPGEELWQLFLVIALHKVRDQGSFHRAAKRDVRLTVGADLIDLGSKADRQADPTPLAFLQLVIDEALDLLPPYQREMVLLRIEGFEVAEIVARTGRAKRTVERVLQGFRQRLADLLHEGE